MTPVDSKRSFVVLELMLDINLESLGLMRNNKEMRKRDFFRGLIKYVTKLCVFSG